MNAGYRKPIQTGNASGEVELSISRDRNRVFDLQIVEKHPSDIFGIEDWILTLGLWHE
jgi:hypothetical protein